MNPLLDFSGLPRFSEVAPAHVTPAVEQLLADCRSAVSRLENLAEPPGWDNFVQPLEDTNERLSRAWGQVSHLNAVMNSPELRAAYNANLPTITSYYAELGQNQALFEKYKALRASAAFESLRPSQKRIVENELRDFRLGGADLPQDRKARFREIQEQLAALAAKFEENLIDTVNAWGLVVENAEEVAGIPDDVLAAARDAARKDGREGWKFTLQAPSYLPVQQYAEHRPLREQLYRAYATRASEFGPKEWDNSTLLMDILRLRREEARLLGLADYAELSLVPKMAKSAQEVLDFLDNLAARAKPFGAQDVDELRRYARDELNLPDLQSWDVAYASEKLRAQRYAFSDQEVKQYFPEPEVLAGMFRVVQGLYGVQVKPAAAPVWHQDVKFFEIADRDGHKVGQFYLDLYARNSKRGGAWMDDAITRRRRDGDIQTPVAYLTCNFSGPVGNRPALFTHDEVLTLFHEFGHGLHHLLTHVEDLGVSGINGVEWDAVELPSQFMENFCWEWDVVQHMARHVDTGAVMPRALFDKMVAAKNFQSGMQMLRQIEFSLFDMHLHHDFDPSGARTPQDVLNDIRARVAVIVPPPYNRFPNSFSHIFAGGYAAGYYSYKWAEVLSADAYAMFEENGVLNEAVGRRFRDEILGVGGSRPALESFVAFRGREPTIDALLRHSGMTEAA